MIMPKRFPSLGLLFLISCAAQPPEGRIDARIADPGLLETSGLTVSPQDPQFLWALNDSGAGAQFHLMDREGNARGILRLKGIKNRDWEDLASFRTGGRSCLLAADVGDNAGKRDVVQLHVILEPTLPGPDNEIDHEAKPLWTIRFRYPDGPRDCESVAVDEKAKKVILLSKRTRPPVLYELPLGEPKSDQIIVAKRLGTVPRLPVPPNSLPHPHGSQPTAMDFSPDGKKAALLTYRGVFLVHRSAGQSWHEAFQQKPQQLGAHALPQAEALAFDRSGDSLYFTSEGRHPELHRWPAR